MRLLYISGPYRAPTLRGVIDNIRKAEAVAIELWKMGYAVICPHLNTRLFPEGAGELENDQEIDYIEGDLTILDRFIPGEDGIVMLPGWNSSEGAKLELKKAFENRLKLYFWPQDRLRLKAEGNISLRKDKK